MEVFRPTVFHFEFVDRLDEGRRPRTVTSPCARAAGAEAAGVEAIFSSYSHLPSFELNVRREYGR